MGLVLLFVGLAVGAVGIAAAAASAAASRVELYRWVTGGARGGKAARALLAAPARVTGAALAISAIGTLVAGFGVRAVLDTVDPILLAITVLVLAAPVAAIVIYALPAVLGRLWVESTIRAVVPWVARLAAVFAPVMPHDSAIRPRTDPTRARVPGDASEKPEAGELALVSGVLAYTEKPVREVMTPRTDIVAIPDGTPSEQIGRVFAESRYSRIPVYRDSLDNIVGMHYAFDLLKLPPGGRLPVRPVTMTPGSRPCADLLFEMQRDRRHMAVVLDEYGGTDGIVTLDDLLGELVEETFEVAEMQDEPAAPPQAVIEVEGTTPSVDVAQQLGVSLPSDAETIGGLLSRAAGRIPRIGDRFELAGLEFNIISATATRVERVTVRRAGVLVIRLESREAL